MPFAPAIVTAITYSPAYTLVPTYECFNRCSYCNFRRDPGQDSWLSLTAARQRLQRLQGSGVIEVLLLSGEVSPRSPRRAAWVQHLYSLCQLALEMGFLPHTNAGPLSAEEMAHLGAVNVSMGLMLEQLTPRLLAGVHRHAPSKEPQLRLRQLRQAGELKIPFTTGLLLGIGESEADWVESLDAIATLHRRYGHIQEVILQPHSPGGRQAETGAPFPPERLVAAVTLARQRLPADIALQIPPNLISPEQLRACLAAGATDLGGISPVDEVNPDYAHSTAPSLAQQLHPWPLRPRLPVYPQYLSWLSPTLRQAVNRRQEQLASQPPENSAHNRAYNQSVLST